MAAHAAPSPALAPEAPAVSVVMNCLNSSRHLREALDSLMAQTFTDFEVIFWDNASTDASPAIAQSYGPKVRYFRGETIVPLGAGRNLALAQARGRCLAFLDCDDLWRPEKLAAQMALFDANPRVGLVCTDTEIFDGRGMRRRLFAATAPQRGMAFAALMERQWISMSSAMIRATALTGLSPKGVAPGTGENGGWFDESLNVCEEADVFYRIAHDWELDHVDAPLTLWRVHGANTTFRKFGQFADETLYILDKHRRLYPGYDADYADLAALLTRRAAFQKAVDLWRQGRNAAARSVLRPWRSASRKHRLFWWASYLPGACFDLAARLYFALPAALRR
ncbi:glycosyltransferase family 2 protein [Desulfovibrio legallii]|uniref:Glycosyltransferase involved in cell wall bisynthesis n=1 Tax=Desulfovibrio legallii TaxID=571438 RepID=A0A1G7Q4Q3_9BACT|nr:glycosyltransferase [Desulfovibrio legallii]SDF93486.1 Glycosyltransferase involved in cell wall bisynthesis [Desulfovibrio legallii]